MKIMHFNSIDQSKEVEGRYQKRLVKRGETFAEQAAKEAARAEILLTEQAGCGSCYTNVVLLV